MAGKIEEPRENCPDVFEAILDMKKIYGKFIYHMFVICLKLFN
jgi:hypothetical protein